MEWTYASEQNFTAEHAESAEVLWILSVLGGLCGKKEQS